jgi:hypothetical protein
MQVQQNKEQQQNARFIPRGSANAGDGIYRKLPSAGAQSK